MRTSQVRPLQAKMVCRTSMRQRYLPIKVEKRRPHLFAEESALEAPAKKLVTNKYSMHTRKNSCNSGRTPMEKR